MIAVRNTIPSLEVSSLATNCEILWVKITIPGHVPHLIGAYYRPVISDLTSLHELDLSLTKLYETYTNPVIWLGGNFNAPKINWENMAITDSSYTSIHSLLIDIVLDHTLTQFVKSPTRFQNTLDLFLSNHLSLVSNVEVLPGVSDHEIILIDANVELSITKQNARKIPLYSKANWDVIRSKLQLSLAQLHTTIIENTDINVLWNEFTNIIRDLSDKYIYLIK